LGGKRAGEVGGKYMYLVKAMIEYVHLQEDGGRCAGARKR